MGGGGLLMKGELEVRRGLMKWEMGTEGTLGLSGIAENVTGEVLGKESILCRLIKSLVDR